MRRFIFYLIIFLLTGSTIYWAVGYYRSSAEARPDSFFSYVALDVKNKYNWLRGSPYEIISGVERQVLDASRLSIDIQKRLEIYYADNDIYPESLRTVLTDIDVPAGYELNYLRSDPSKYLLKIIDSKTGEVLETVNKSGGAE